MKTIAIEEHFITPMYREKIAANEFRNFYLTSRSEQIGHDIVEQNADLGTKRLAHMDAAGVDVQVLSFGSPGPQGFGADIAIPMARDANDRAHAAVMARPERFAAFAALPTADPLASARELERCVTQLGFKGAMIHGHTRGSFLDEKKYWPIFEAAQALDVPIYLHPTLAHPDALHSYFAGYEELARAGWGFAIDTSCHFLRIVFAGVFDAYPRLKIILGHYGEALPFLLTRVDRSFLQYHVPKGSGSMPPIKKRPSEYLLGNMFVTTSGNYLTAAFTCTRDAIGIERMLLGTDYPFESTEEIGRFLDGVGMTAEEQAKLYQENPERLGFAL